MPRRPGGPGALSQAPGGGFWVDPGFLGGGGLGSRNLKQRLDARVQGAWPPCCFWRTRARQKPTTRTTLGISKCCVHCILTTHTGADINGPCSTDEEAESQRGCPTGHVLPHGQTQDPVQPRSPGSDTTLLLPWRAGLCTCSSPSPSPASAQVHVGVRRLADRPGCHRAARVDQHVHFLSQQQTPRVNRKNSYHDSDSLGSP